MKIKGHCVTLSIILLSLTSASLVEADAGADLQKAAIFALGGVGVAGTMSPGERALREMLKEKDATE